MAVGCWEWSSAPRDWDLKKIVSVLKPDIFRKEIYYTIIEISERIKRPEVNK